MLIAQHKLAIALVISVLAHGLLLFGKTERAMTTDASVISNESIELEFLVVAYQKNERSNLSEKLVKTSEPVVHTNTPGQPKTDRLLPEKQKLNARSEDSEQKTKHEDAYTQEQKIAKSETEQNHLMELVYQAISQHKRYPLMARRLGQQGRVLLNFVMHPDGQVTDVEVTLSSNYSVLDRAARNAVVAISPLVMASDYLDDQKIFDVAVEFRLN